jgi:hypothetical protein
MHEVGDISIFQLTDSHFSMSDLICGYGTRNHDGRKRIGAKLLLTFSDREKCKSTIDIIIFYYSDLEKQCQVRVALMVGWLCRLGEDLVSRFFYYYYCELVSCYR